MSKYLHAKIRCHQQPSSKRRWSFKLKIKGTFKMSKSIQLAKCFIKHAKTEKNLIGLCLAIFTAITAIGLYSIFTYVPD